MDIVKLKKLVNEACERTIAQAVATRDRELAALDAAAVIEARLGSGGKAKRKPEKEKHGELARAIDDAISKINGEFDQNDVIAEIEAVKPGFVVEYSVSAFTNALKRRARRGVIRLVNQGGGKRATTYEMVKK